MEVKVEKELGFAAGLRDDPLRQLAGKMRLLLTAELSRGCGKEEGSGSKNGAVGARAAEPGLEEFISLVEDVHRSVERTTRQQ